MSQYDRRDGFYDDRGHWQRTKFCFVYCGERCTCGPPMGVYRRSPTEKTEDDKGE